MSQSIEGMIIIGSPRLGIDPGTSSPNNKHDNHYTNGPWPYFHMLQIRDKGETFQAKYINYNVCFHESLCYYRIQLNNVCAFCRRYYKHSGLARQFILAQICYSYGSLQS